MNFKEAKQVLGLNGTLTPETVHQAFRKMAQQYHPDRYQTLTQQAWATRKFIKIKEARDLLINSIASDDINENIFQEEDFFHKDTKSTATTLKDLTDFLKSMDLGDRPDHGDGAKEVDGNRVEHSVVSFPLFRFVSSFFEWCQKKENIFIREILGFIGMGLLMVMMPLFGYYFMVIFILTGIFTASGIDAYSNSRKKRGRFAYLFIITIASVPFFILPWYFYGDFQQIIKDGWRFWVLFF